MILPESIDHEKAILARCILYPESVSEISDLLKPDHMSNIRHRIIYSGIIDLYNKKLPTDLPSLTNHLRTIKKIADIGGAYYLSEITNFPIAVDIQGYCEIIKNKHVSRQVLLKCNEIIQQCQSDDGESLLNYAQSEIMRIDSESNNSNIKRLGDMIPGLIDDLEDTSNRGITGFKTGFKYLDKITLGLQRSDLIILAGRPGMGKSAMASTLGSNISENGVAVLEFHLEMSRGQALRRKIATGGNVDLMKLRSKTLDAEDWQRVHSTAERMYELDMFIDDTPDMTVDKLRSRTRQMVKDYNVGVVIIDYIQLFKTPRGERRDIEVGEITRSLKMMAKELNVVVIALSQLNRKVEDRDDKRPKLSDLRESGNIEQDADMVMFIHRPEYYIQSFKDSDDDKKRDTYRKLKGLAELIVAKQRNGKTDSVKLTWLESSTAFRDYARE